MSPIIHLVRREGGGVRPLCGRFVESRNWTTLRHVATCPECLARGRDGAETMGERRVRDVEVEPA